LVEFLTGSQGERKKKMKEKFGKREGGRAREGERDKKDLHLEPM
jgi:hypothetical protein